MKRWLWTMLVVTGCDLNAAYESYRDRACAEACGPGQACPARCSVSTEDGGTSDAGQNEKRGAHTLFKRAMVDTFVVLRLDAPQGPRPSAMTILEERRLSDGALIGAELLNERGLSLSGSFSNEGALARSEDGSQITFAVAPSAASPRLVDETMAHRIVAVRKTDFDWGRVFQGFPQTDFDSVVAAADGTLYGTGDTNEVAGLSLLAPDAGTPQRIGQGQRWYSVQIADGRLAAAAYGSGLPRIEDLGTIQNPTDDAGTPIVSFTTNRVATGFAFVDEQPSIPGVDALYVAERDEVWKFTKDAGSWHVRWTKPQPTPRCRFLAARAGGPALCTTEKLIYVLEEVDGGVSMRALPGAAFDAGSSAYRGVAFPPN
jgi:hypothetical protein